MGWLMPASEARRSLIARLSVRRERGEPAESMNSGWWLDVEWWPSRFCKASAGHNKGCLLGASWIARPCLKGQFLMHGL